MQGGSCGEVKWAEPGVCPQSLPQWLLLLFLGALVIKSTLSPSCILYRALRVALGTQWTELALDLPDDNKCGSKEP